MRTNVLYRVWPKALPPELCRLLKALGDDLTAIKATVDDGTHVPERGRLLEELRRTMVGFWDESHWINGLLMHYAMQANREFWNFEISLISGVQYATYNESSFFTWHTDELDTPYGPLSPAHWVRLNRKLSVTVHLSGPDGLQRRRSSAQGSRRQPDRDRGPARAGDRPRLSLERCTHGHAGDLRGAQLPQRLGPGPVLPLTRPHPRFGIRCTRPTAGNSPATRASRRS